MKVRADLGIAAVAVALSAIAAAPASATSPNPDSSVAAENAATAKISKRYVAQKAFCKTLSGRKSRIRCVRAARKRKLVDLAKNRARFTELRRRSSKPTPTPKPKDPGSLCRHDMANFSVGPGTIQLRLKPALTQKLAASGATLIASDGATYDSVAGIVVLPTDNQTHANEVAIETQTRCNPWTDGSRVTSGSVGFSGKLAVERLGTQEVLLDGPVLDVAAEELKQTDSASPLIKRFWPVMTCDDGYPIADGGPNLSRVINLNSQNPELQVSTDDFDDAVFSDPGLRSSLGLSTPATEPDAELVGTLPLVRFIY